MGQSQLEYQQAHGLQYNFEFRFLLFHNETFAPMSLTLVGYASELKSTVTGYQRRQRNN